MIITFLQLIYEFIVTGLLSFGGGLATLPFFYSIAARYPWFSSSDLANMWAVSQSAPGPMGINLATYAGFKALISNGLTPAIIGGVTAVFSLVIPSIIIIIIVSKVLKKFSESKVVKGALYGLKPVTIGLITAAGIKPLKESLFITNKFELSAFDYYSLILIIVIFAVNMKYKKLHPAFSIAFAATVGIIFKM